MNSTTEDIATTVKAIIIDVLLVDESDVTPTANFFDDLGGESIDVLDLPFQCEKRLGVTVSFQELASTEINLDANGRLAASSIAAIKVKIPQVDFSDFERDPRPERLRSLFTVEMITRAVCAAVNAKQTQA